MTCEVVGSSDSVVGAGMNGSGAFGSWFRLLGDRLVDFVWCYGRLRCRPAVSLVGRSFRGYCVCGGMSRGWIVGLFVVESVVVV
jgi:hypothetical protein